MVTIQEYTTKNPIQMIGQEAGVCYGSDITDPDKNYKRGIDCLETNHGRTWEFPDVYMILDGYSARVIREFYTHIAGAPTRLQSSTRYIGYGKFDYYVPSTIYNNERASEIYEDAMNQISVSFRELQELGVPKEDIANILPLGMKTKIVVKMNLRTLITMSHQRLCSRAYHEYRSMFIDIMKALSEYSSEWNYLVVNYFMPKCELYGYCTEKKSCGRKPKKEIPNQM